MSDDCGGGGCDSGGGGDVSGTGGCDSTSYHHDSGHHDVGGSGGCDSTSYHHDSGHHDVGGRGGCDSTSYHYGSGHHGTDHFHSSANDNDQNVFKDYSFVGDGIGASDRHSDYDAGDRYSSTEKRKDMKKVKRKEKDMHQQDCCVLI